MSEPAAPMIQTSVPEVGDLNHELHRSFRMLSMARGELIGLLPAGLDPATAQLLAMLVKQGPARQNELAEGTLLDPSTVSRRVGQLVEHGLVRRRADPTDGRVVRLAATEAGFALFGRVRAARDQTTRDVLSGWTPDDIAQLTGLLRRFNEAVDGHRRRAGEQSTTRGET